MADHLRKQLRAALGAALVDLSVTGGNVFLGRSWPMVEGNYPALLIWARGGSSQFDGMKSVDAEIPLERDERIVIEAVISEGGAEKPIGEAGGGVVLDDKLDDICAEVEAAVMSDEGVAALVDLRVLLATEIDAAPGDGDRRRAWARMTWRFVFRTEAGDATTKV